MGGISLRNGRKVLMEPWIIDPNITYGSKTFTDDHVLSLEDRGYDIIMNSASDKTFTTPSVGEPEIGVEYIFYNIGTGRLTIQVADSDTVDDSNAGGTIYSDTEGISSLRIRLVSASHWQITGANGAWVTT